MNLATQLRHKVTIQQRTAGFDALGQPLDTWVDVASPWADIRNLNGLETIKGGAESSLVRASIRIRYRTDLNAGMRIVHGATTYNITAILLDEVGKIHMDLTCEVIK
jgi:SPP1 family predicted phage head-tail adaptor